VMKDVNPDPNGMEGGTGYWDGAWEFYFYGITGQKLMTLDCNYADNGDGGYHYANGPTCTTVGYNLYFGSKLVQSNGSAVVTDRLGSVRYSAGVSRSYFPYGEERTSTQEGTEKFGTYFSDAPGQDYAEQRYYNNGTGRFWSVDPGGMKSAKAADPTSLNRYAYAGGDPVNNFDPTGQQYIFLGVGTCWTGGKDPQPYPCDQYQWSGLIGWALPAAGAANGAGGPAEGRIYSGFEDAVQDLQNSPDCAALIGSNAGGIPYSGAGLADKLSDTPVTTSTDGGNIAVTNFAGGSDVGTPMDYQTAYTTAGAIYLNGNYFPDPTQQNINFSNGSTTSLLQVVNAALGTNMSAEQLGAFVFLHELSHIVDSNNSHKDSIDSTSYNTDVIKTCIH